MYLTYHIISNKITIIGYMIFFIIGTYYNKYSYLIFYQFINLIFEYKILLYINFPLKILYYWFINNHLLIFTIHLRNIKNDCIDY